MNSRHHNDRRPTTLFPIGALILSAGVDRLVRAGRLDPVPFFQRHASGDWGDVTDEQWQANNAALQSGGRLESCYVVHRELSIRILSDTGRSETRIVLASEH